MYLVYIIEYLMKQILIKYSSVSMVHSKYYNIIKLIILNFSSN